MKKRTIKMLAMAMAITMVFSSSVSVYAREDGCAEDTGVGCDKSGPATITFDDPAPSSSGSSSSSSSDSGSSYSEPSYSGGGSSESYSGGGGGESYSAPSADGSGSASSSVSAPKAAGSNTGVTGGETFRALAKSGAGTYSVTHKGIKIATFGLMDADKNAKSCTAVYLKHREDGKWAINYEVADATGLTVGAPLDRTYMYNTLGVSYVTINDEIIIDIEAEAAAK